MALLICLSLVGQQQIRNVKSVYVEPSHGSSPSDDTFNMIRDKVVSHLVAVAGTADQANKITIVDDPDKADAILRLTINVQDERPEFIRINGTVRLVREDNGEVVWADDVNVRSRGVRKSVSSAFADKVAQDFFKAVAPKEKQ
jgi:hypothetical protein